MARYVDFFTSLSLDALPRIVSGYPHSPATSLWTKPATQRDKRIKPLFCKDFSMQA